MEKAYSTNNVEKAVLLYSSHLTRLCKTVHAWAGVSQTQSTETKISQKLDLFHQLVYGMYVYKLNYEHVLTRQQCTGQQVYESGRSVSGPAGQNSEGKT